MLRIFIRRTVDYLRIPGVPWKLLVAAALMHSAMSAGQTGREQLTKLLAEFQGKPYDADLRKQIIQTALNLKPQPAIPEEARRHFVMGTATLKEARSLRGAWEATKAFRNATNIAPWWPDAYYNLAVAEELAGMYESSMESLQLYLMTKPGPAEERAAQDHIYALEAKSKITSTPRGIEGFWERTYALRDGRWERERGPRRPVWEVRKNGESYKVTLFGSEEDWRVDVLEATPSALRFNTTLKSKYSQRNEPISYVCRLDGDELQCTGGGYNGGPERYALRKYCEVVDAPGITGPPVLCRP